MRRLPGRPGTAIVSVLLTLGVVTTAVPAEATGTPTGAAASDRAEARVGLPRAVRGATAVRLLAGRVDEAAARNDMSAAELTELLTTDPSAWLDTTGAVFFKEAAADGPTEDLVSATAPLAETFQLHSKAGSARTIFLDVDGGGASATAWHATYPAIPTAQPAWDPAGNGAAFTDAELAMVQTVWQSVAEDYAPFDVDVTTADPGAAAILRSSPLDPTYGSHVLITPSVGTQAAICPSGCGGVAYIGVFDEATGAGGDGYGFAQPAWVFPHQLADSPKYIAEAASHEVGHQFGLVHDGNESQPYDGGHGAWAPIMGSGYDHPVSQWSRGDYAGADNQEDDVATILGIAGARTDEAPATVVAAPRVPTGTAYVTSRTDVDTYLLGTCSGTMSVTASPLASQADLDVRLSILDSLGQVVATDDPASGEVTESVASGMGASLSRGLGSGTYFVSVDGVGNGSWSTGYDDYGSMGAYSLTATGCDGTVGSVLTRTTANASAVGRTVTLTATPSALIGTPVGDLVFREGTTVVGTVPLGAGSPTLSLPSVPRGVHTYTATFVPLGTTHAGSVSPPTTVTVKAASTTGLTASAAGQVVTLDVQVATDDGAAAGTVELRDGGALVGTRTLSGGAASIALASVAPGDHAYQATFVPGDATTYDGSSSPVRTITVAAPAPALAPVSASTTTLKAPRRARAGTRPTVTVRVSRGTATASGTVVISFGTRSRTVTLTDGRASLRLPRVRAGRLRIRARYAGNPTTTGSSARRTIRVRA